jgi:hypothetical protein
LKNGFGKKDFFVWLKKELRLLWGKLRRLFIVYCKPKLIKTSLPKRHGECKQCANCCKLLFKCPFLSEDNLCLIYNSKFRPKSCIYFPLSVTDLEDVRLAHKYICGYSFDNK